jgi:hypothetical protein
VEQVEPAAVGNLLLDRGLDVESTLPPARFLAKRGADVNFVDPKSGRTALRYGVEKEFDPAQLAWLVDHGASPDIKDKSGVSARDRASRKRNKWWLDALV